MISMKRLRRMEVTFQQAVDDWKIRTAIWKATGYYY